MKFFQKNLLLFVVFLSGAAVLIIEVAAFRILAPYFGNTLYVTSSIIGTVLGALSLGYYIGGILSDTHPRYSLFFLLIILAGVFSLLIERLARIFLDPFGYVLDMRWGPPISSFILFFAPSMVLGMMSPFAIKLQSIGEKNVGRVVGSVFFFSTLGSIVGSFLAGFFLVPFFGIKTIIISVGLALFIMGAVGFVTARSKENKGEGGPPLFLVLTIFYGVFVWGASFFVSPEPFLETKRVLFQKEGLYGRIAVKEKDVEGEAVRVLELDRATHGGMARETGRPLGYIQYADLVPVFVPHIKTALILGGGAYLFPKELLRSTTIELIDAVEIEPELYGLARDYFDLAEDARLQNHITDGRRFLHETTREYDFIFVDVFSSLYSIPFHFTTQEFFRLAKEKLSPEGFFMMNVTGMLGEGGNGMLLSEIKTFRSVFPASYIFAFDSRKKKEPQNFTFIGFRDDARVVDFSDPKILNHTNYAIRTFPEKRVELDGLNLDSVHLFTDDFAPVEYLAAKVIVRN